MPLNNSFPPSSDKPAGFSTAGSDSWIQDDKALSAAIRNVYRPFMLIRIDGRPTLAPEGLPVSIESDGNRVKGRGPATVVPALPLETLGDTGFTRDFGIRFPYVMGAMAHGITSVQMVIAAAKAGMIAFFGAAGMIPDAVEKAVYKIRSGVGDLPFGSNLIHSPFDPELESRVSELYLRLGVRRICASAFMNLTPALVQYRIKGIHESPAGDIVCPNQVIAKVSREEVAKRFFSPPPDKVLYQLIQGGAITRREADLARFIPMCDALTAEADSGGHTDNRPAITLFPTIAALRDEMVLAHGYPQNIPVGLGGGICTPHSTAAAFAMGASYVLTGTVNQACVEAGISPSVRRLLAETRQADVAMAPCADMFEMGVRVQVLKRGTMFAQRAARLWDIFQTYSRIEDIPAEVRNMLERDYFRCTLEQEWVHTCSFFRSRNQDPTLRASSDPKYQMALLFRSYLGQSSLWAQTGDESRKMDYQVWCGPGMGAFNAWTAGTFLEKPENRDVVTVAKNLLLGAAVLTRLTWIRSQGVSLPVSLTRCPPLSPTELDTIIETTSP